jgi:hypothetical protein
MSKKIWFEVIFHSSDFLISILYFYLVMILWSVLLFLFHHAFLWLLHVCSDFLLHVCSDFIHTDNRVRGNEKGKSVHEF